MPKVDAAFAYAVESNDRLPGSSVGASFKPKLRSRIVSCKSLQRSSLLSGIERGDGAHGTQEVPIVKEAAISGRYESEAENVAIRVCIVACKC